AVFLTAWTEAELAATAREIAADGGRAAYTAADLTKEADCTRIVAACREKFGRIDVIVDTAGPYGPVAAVADHPIAGFDSGVRVNALCPGPVTETMMSKDLGVELARRLGVNPQEQLEGFLKTLLQGRGQTAEEVARAALFLCSDQASAITGQSINVDGGAVF